MLRVIDFHHVLLRFATSRFMDAAVTPLDLLETFRRELDIYGIRPVGGSSYESLLDRLVYEKFSHISDVYPELAQLRQLTAKKALSTLFKRSLTESCHYILTIGEGSRSLVGRVNPSRPSRAS